MAKALRIARIDRGFTLIEVVIAMLILAIGIIGTLTIFISSKNSSLVAQRHEVAIAQAQKAMEDLRNYDYKNLGLSKAPAVTNRLVSDPNKLGYYTNANTTDSSSFTVRSGSPGVTEKLALLDSVTGGTVNPDPDPFTVTAGSSTITGKIYRYVTWRPESCGNDSGGNALCPGNRQTKRLIVAVTLDSNGHSALTKPVWIGTVVFDPKSLPYQ